MTNFANSNESASSVAPDRGWPTGDDELRYAAASQTDGLPAPQENGTNLRSVTEDRTSSTGTKRVKLGRPEVRKGVIMGFVNAEQAKIVKDAGAVDELFVAAKEFRGPYDLIGGGRGQWNAAGRPLHPHPADTAMMQLGAVGVSSARTCGW